MPAKAFIDTNLFIYLQRADVPEKKAAAREAVDYFDCFTSTQVMNELCNIFTKKYPTL